MESDAAKDIKRVMQKITLHATLSKEYLHEEGKKLGLKKEALAMFLHFSEVPIAVWVDTSNGRAYVIGQRSKLWNPMLPKM